MNFLFNLIKYALWMFSFLVGAYVLFVIAFVVYGYLEKDFSNEYMFQNIVGKTYQIKEDIYITGFEGSKKITLESYRRVFSNKEQYDDYLKNPLSWRDYNIRIYGVIQKGTKFKVERVLGYTHVEMGNLYRVLPLFKDRIFESDRIDAQYLFEWNTRRGADQYYFLVDESLLQEIKD